MPTQLEVAFDIFFKTFVKYSGKEGNKYKLTKGELAALLQNELTNFIDSKKDPQLVNKIINELDSNKDNEVDFNEFVVLVAAVAVATNDLFKELGK